jgi:sulfotransferase family protein
LPVFPFNKAFGIARSVKAFLNRKRIESKKQELSQIRNELRAAKGRTERQEHKKRKKSKKQEIFRLKNELRGPGERVEDALAGQTTSQVVGEAETGALPDFVIIGAKKCGTTSLYRLLTQHPHVERAALKEPHYFLTHFDEGIEWYRRCFPPPRWKDGRRSITGEATPGYLYHPLVPERMAKVVPQAHLIALLRNPVDRAYSDYQQVARKGQEPRTFEEAVEEAMEVEKTHPLPQEDETSEYPQRASFDDALYYEYLSRGIYVDQLLPWSRFFDDEQMLVLKSEDFFERELDTLKVVLDFLGLPDWEPEAWEIRKKGKYEQKMDPVTRKRLEDYFGPHNRRLYEYLGVDFGW